MSSQVGPRNRVSVVLGLLLLVTLLPAAARSVTRQQAIDHVINNIIPTLDEEQILRAYALQSTTPAGVVVAQNGVEVLGSTPGFDTWFVWLDLKPLSHFAHPTKFLFLNASGANVTSVTEFDGDLWPTINGVTYYEDQDDRDTSLDLFWEDGAAAKPGAPRGAPKPDLQRGERLLREFRARLGQGNRTQATNSWGMIVTTIDTAKHAGVLADVHCAVETFESLGVTNITWSQNKNKANTLACIDSLPNNCDKLYVYWVGHGKKDQLVFSGETPLSPKDFACKLKDQGAKEYCLIMETCFSGSFLDEFAEKGLDGFHVTSTSDSAYTSIFSGAAAGTSPFDGAPYAHYLWDCLQGGLTSIDAHQWADSLVEVLRDSLTSSPDSTRWRKNWGGKYANDDDAQGEYVHTFASGGVGGTGVGEPFEFKVGRGCSTVCIDFPGIAGSDTCGNFTLSCAVNDGTGKKWIKKGTYNWNVGKTVYFRTYGLPNATGEYSIAMHSNKGGVRVGITWLSGTSTPVTTANSYVFNGNSIGWIDGTSAEFNPGLGVPGGFHFFSWNDGAPYEDIPAHTGPNWFETIQMQILLEPDPLRSFLYNAGDPALGYAENTILILQAAAILDPLNPTQTFPTANVGVQAFGESGDTYGPYQAVFEDLGPGKASPRLPGVSMQNIPPVIINLGTIKPEPLVISIAVPGPGFVAWDAILLMPETSIVTNVVVPGTPAHLLLAQNEPNPFNPRTTLRYELPQDGFVSLRIFDIRGRLVRTLVNTTQTHGPKQVIWDGRSDRGVPVASGVYVYRLDAASEVRARKMALIR